jgi:hypothetical protein
MTRGQGNTFQFMPQFLDQTRRKAVAILLEALP